MEDKVKEWIQKEGYPLEFSTAHKFKKRKFSVEQSYFTKNKDGKAREVDVLAATNLHLEKSFLRIKHVVECKWSKDKPWVLFKDEKRIAATAMVTQLISSNAGEALVWAAAGKEEFKELKMFAENGFSFSGRQAFSKGNDLFYQSVQGVISNCLNIARFYDDYDYPPERSLLATILLPVIVVDGKVFEATYDSESNDLNLEEVGHSRLRWKGNDARQLITIVDVVTSDHLDEFLDKRAKEIEILSQCLGETLQQLLKCFSEKTEEHLVITPGARGVLGVPKVIRQLKEVASPNKQLHSDASDDAPMS